METKFTKGPWRVENEPYPHLRGPHNQCIFARDYGSPADMLLAATAPELFDNEHANLVIMWNTHTYLKRNEASLPPMSLASLEVAIKKTEALLAKALGPQ